MAQRCPRHQPMMAQRFGRWLAGLWLGALVTACGSTAPTLPEVSVVTVVVTPTTGPTQTPLVVVELQTVVVTATAARRAPVTRTARVSPTASATPTATVPPAATTGAASPTPPVLPTSTPRPTPAIKYAAPALTIPVEGEAFGGGVQPLLQWEGVALAEDEYYEVTIERNWQNQPYYAGSEWVKASELLVPDFVRGTSDTDQYTWWVTIKRLTGTNQAGGKVGESISPPSPQRTFIWHPTE